MLSHNSTRRRFTTAVGLSGLTLTGTGIVTARGRSRNFRAHLSGENEVPPVETNAQGQAKFQLNKAGDELSYNLIVANIEDVFMAHIHSAPPGANGPVVTWLYPEEGPPPQLIPGRFDGLLATGTITADDLVGPLDGHDLDELIALAGSGDAYVNVHTLEHRGGEVRGQIH
jgi:hypothetical protein